MSYLLIKRGGVNIKDEPNIENNNSSYFSMTQFLIYRNEMSPLLNKRHQFEKVPAEELPT